MARLNEIDKRVLDSMTGRAKMDALLEDAGLPTVRSVADSLGEFPDDVSRCLSGHRGRRPTMDRIRGKLAGRLGLTRGQVDEMLGGTLQESAPAEAIS